MSRSAAQTSNLARVEHRRISGLTGKREVLHLESLDFRRLLSAAAMKSTVLDGYGQTPLSFERNQGQIDVRAFDGDDRLQLDSDGDLNLHTAGSVVRSRPVWRHP